jgi:ribosomal protein S18 acetylase RimI-like enzyme
VIAVEVDRRPADEDLQKLWLAVWAASGPRDFAAVLARSLVYLCAYDRSRLVGFVNVAWDGSQHASIFDTAVHPDYRRRGLGTRLVKQAIALARQRGAHWLHVDFEPHLADFYRKCGFYPTTAGLIRL